MSEPLESDGFEVRVVVPRDSLPMAPRPEYYSQTNSHLLGLSKRAVLELLRRPGAPPVTSVGKLRLVRRDSILAYLDGLAEQKERRMSKDARPSRDEADRLLLELGCTPGPADS